MKKTSVSKNKNSKNDDEQTSKSVKTKTSNNLKTNLKLSFIYSMIGGVFASFSSVCGKIALDSTFLTQYVSSDQIDLIARVIGFASIFICTTMQWRYAAKGMDLASSTVTSTVITTSSNFFFTAFFGWLFFKENLSLKWWLGASLIMMGLFFMNSDDINEQKEKPKNKKN
ncbi:hypothetical protein DICPUDRAFT_157307 [Dictyostelium purpureum]|uniref:EamA domain-containing protein n=1 Tax=Dictyostelium purpureum TaxID=5786 RepID=F0ZYS9_DICPU|nr:uncharacterized protein DICPUDRAFT_157307 [Dictyostelium purpureum]EGC30903.1 hypothetical protein DICPUDRAFT_157307 [Dictyostelium purpureum]|eukprot:XP_003292576.1 hypothetical protein DICPUDRAFT_157307 [Dictyostelium purpureum]